MAALSTSEVRDRRLILHSIYFDATKKLSEGRKVPLSQACDHPILRDLIDAVQALGLPFEPEARLDATPLPARLTAPPSPGQEVQP